MMLALDLFPKIDFPVVNITTKTDTIEETVNTINVR